MRSDSGKSYVGYCLNCRNLVCRPGWDFRVSTYSFIVYLQYDHHNFQYSRRISWQYTYIDALRCLDGGLRRLLCIRYTFNVISNEVSCRTCQPTVTCLIKTGRPSRSITGWFARLPSGSQLSLSGLQRPSGGRPRWIWLRIPLNSTFDSITFVLSSAWQHRSRSWAPTGMGKGALSPWKCCKSVLCISYSQTLSRLNIYTLFSQFFVSTSFFFAGRGRFGGSEWFI